MSFNLGAVERGRTNAARLAESVTLEGAPGARHRRGQRRAGHRPRAAGRARHGARARRDTALEPDATRRRWAAARIAGHHAEVELCEGVAEHLPFAGASFDLVTMDSVLEHVESPAQTIVEVSRVLKPGGTLFLSWPNKGSLLTIWRDPHYQMTGVVLLPRRAGAFYVERVRRSRRGYWVNTIPRRRWVERRFLAEGVRLRRLVPEGLEKLADPQAIRHSPRVRALAGVAQALRLTAPLQRLAVAQCPAHVYLGVRDD
jgi:SAM-dependent methyltransferase